MIDSKYLKLIVSINECGSLKKAAEKLNLTQSALSHQLKNIEEYLGILLFHRIGNQLIITEAGKEINEKGELILNELKDLELRILEIKENQLNRYIHGYSEVEAQRLKDQANSIEGYLHFDTIWESGSRILEVGCGVGAQTEIIAKRNKECSFYSIDISKESITKAKKRIEELEIDNVKFDIIDVHELKPKKNELFDSVFICFVLEHLSNPKKLLKHVRTLVKPGGTINVIEGDHGSTFFYPENDFARKIINAQVLLQKKKGGNPNIGRELYPLLEETGYKNIEVSPRQIYVDNSKKNLAESFIKNTFTAMMKGISENLLEEKLLTKSDYELGIDGLLRTTKKDGVFSYTFFKGTAKVD